MADGIINSNILLVNAPAGSGKTYRIKSEIRDYTIVNPRDKILCITYTNRAANELLNGIDSPNVYISTIHSYLNEMISPLFNKKEIIALYFEVYSDDILKRINDPEKAESNNKYREKYGDISLSIIKQNVKSISYNETQFNALYYGGLSHNDLLSFTYKILERYPKLYNKINRRFRVIIIDEYQDTSPEVFRIFFTAVKNTAVKLYLYGDKMQQIYKLYDNDLNSTLASINQDDRIIINHRSIPAIVDILNKIYNNPKLDQNHYDKLENIQPDFAPRIIIMKQADCDGIIDKIKSKDSKALVLYIFNRERFEKIGAGNLYNAFSHISKYGFGKQISASDILLNGDETDNQDILLKFMIIMYKINDCWQKKIFGSFLKKCRKNKQIFNLQNVTLRSVRDKEHLYSLWNGIFEKFNSCGTTIGQLISLMDSKNLLEESFMEIIKSDNIYDEVFDIQVCEIIKLENSNSDPYVSTQHGVKGESHDSVVFVAEDSKRNDPRVYMYDFFRVWAKADFSLDEFENFYFKYVDFIQQVDQANQNKEYLISKSHEILDVFGSNEIFNILCDDTYNTYIQNPIKRNAKNLFKDSTIRYVLSAYKLFYVGCSRARRNLTVLIDEDKISEYKNEFIKKIENTGFVVLNRNDI